MRIGNLELANPFLLAPMAGFTDKTMRTLCCEQGASLTFTEMVSAKGLKYGDRKTRKLLELTEIEKGYRLEGQIESDTDCQAGNVSGCPTDCGTGYQIFGHEPDILALAAAELESEDNAALDLNCGCPVPKIVKNGEGSALLRNLDLLHDCVEAMVKATAKPVTAKIRMGFDAGEDLAVEAARAIEAANAQAVTVHGRTRQQYYEGKANWDVITRVKNAVSIPVIGNGDIRSGEDAIRMMWETGCDGVMIARGALGNPWVFRDANILYDEGWQPGVSRESSLVLRERLGEESSPSDEVRIKMLMRHLEMVAEDKGERIAVREIRKFVGHYTKGMRGAAEIRRQANSMNDMRQLQELFCSMILRNISVQK